VALCNLKARKSNSSQVFEIFLGWDDKIPRFTSAGIKRIDLDYPGFVAGRDDRANGDNKQGDEA